MQNILLGGHLQIVFLGTEEWAQWLRALTGSCYKGPGLDFQHPHEGSPPPCVPDTHVVQGKMLIHIIR